MQTSPFIDNKVKSHKQAKYSNGDDRQGSGSVPSVTSVSGYESLNNIKVHKESQANSFVESIKKHPDSFAVHNATKGT